MLRQFAWVSLVSVSAVLMNVVPASAISKSPDHTCFIKTRDNRVIDLTRSICGFDAQQSAKDAKQDAAFLADAMKLMKGAPSEYQQMVQSNPGLLVSEAKNYCQARLAGMSDNQIMEDKYRQISEAAQRSKGGYSRQMELTMGMMGIAAQVAPKHYCPKVGRA